MREIYALIFFSLEIVQLQPIVGYLQRKELNNANAKHKHTQPSNNLDLFSYNQINTNSVPYSLQQLQDDVCLHTTIKPSQKRHIAFVDVYSILFLLNRKLSTLCRC